MPCAAAANVLPACSVSFQASTALVRQSRPQETTCPASWHSKASFTALRRVLYAKRRGAHVPSQARRLLVVHFQRVAEGRHPSHTWSVRRGCDNIRLSAGQLASPR